LGNQFNRRKSYDRLRYILRTEGVSQLVPEWRSDQCRLLGYLSLKVVHCTGVEDPQEVESFTSTRALKHFIAAGLMLTSLFKDPEETVINTATKRVWCPSFVE
jgi:hypothetical protein